MSSHNQNQLKEQADAYLRQHRIMELFEDLCTAVCFNQPENVEEFLVKQLELKQKQGFKTGIFSPEEIQNIFTLFDLKKAGYISENQCRDALKTLASSELQADKIDQADVPSQVDQRTFLSLTESILGITANQ